MASQKDSAAVAAPNASSQAPDVQQQQEIDTAAAFLSLSGPCRQVGDVYLACVATAGLGQCRHLRASFEQCAKRSREESIAQLQLIGGEQFPNEKNKSLRAARMVLGHYMPRQP